MESGCSARTARPGRGDVGRARVHGRPVDLHQQPAVGLLVVGRPDHPDLAGDPVQGRRERQRAAPLARAGLRGELRHALGGVVVRLRHGGVGLVRACRAGALVLVVDPGRGAEGLLQAPGPEQRRGPPQPVDIDDRLGNVDKSLWRHFLGDERGGEQRRQVIGADRLPGARMQRWWRGGGQVRDDVVPPPRQLGFVEKVFDLVIHGMPPRLLRQKVITATVAAPRHGREVARVSAAPRSPCDGVPVDPPVSAETRWTCVGIAVIGALLVMAGAMLGLTAQFVGLPGGEAHTRCGRRGTGPRGAVLRGTPDRRQPRPWPTAVGPRQRCGRTPGRSASRAPPKSGSRRCGRARGDQPGPGDQPGAAKRP